MAIRGPKPLPASVMELFKPGAPAGEGGLALGPNGGVPEAVAGELVPSQRLQRDPDALDYFEMFRRTTGFGHLRPVDGPLLEMLCINLSLFDRVVEEFRGTITGIDACWWEPTDVEPMSIEGRVRDELVGRGAMLVQLRCHGGEAMAQNGQRTY
jgi:hypothetical protein